MPFSEHFSMAKATKAISGRALAAAAIDDTAGPITVPGPPVPSISGDVNDILALAMTKLRQHDPDGRTSIS
jgi:hypothetical protein